MSTLYEIKGDLLTVQQMMEDGSVEWDVIQDTLEGLEYEFHLKADGYARIMKNLKAQAEAYDAEIKRMTERKKSLENHAERLKKTLEQAMIETGDEDFNTELFRFKIQDNPPKLVIDDPNKIPKKYLIPQPPKPDNVAIKELLGGLKDKKNKWAHIERGRSLRIK